MENTYKTNRYNMYLFQVSALLCSSRLSMLTSNYQLQVTGITNTDSLANFAFGIINGEAREHFDWLVRQLESVREEINAEIPHVVITDKDDVPRDALRAAMPSVQQQLCIYHIVANVRAKIRSRFRQPGDPLGLDTDDLIVPDDDDDPDRLQCPADSRERGQVQRRSHDDLPPLIRTNTALRICSLCSSAVYTYQMRIASSRLGEVFNANMAWIRDT